MRAGERPGGAGLVQRDRPGQGSGLEHQRLQVVVQDERLAAPGGHPLVAGGLVQPVVDDQLRGAQHDPHLPADQPDRHGVAVHPHGDLAVAVDAGGQQQTGLERLVRQRDQPGRLGGEVLADRADPRPDPA